ncbi:MAG TPA: SRPBCC family protein [Variovorax sp.]|nr:SRPBCC family protein [Variovorax sp.]
MTESKNIEKRAFIHTRLIDAPPTQVFRAFSEPERLARWWGPKGFSSTFQTCEFRPGGAWRFVLHGPDGIDYPNENVFAQIDAPARLVIEHLSEHHHFLLTVTLDAQDSQTLLGWQQVFDTVEERERVAGFVLEANEQVLDRLQAEVAKIPS